MLSGVLASLAAASPNTKENDIALVTTEYALPLILSATMIQWHPLFSSASKKDEPKLLKESDGFIFRERIKSRRAETRILLLDHSQPL
jgi:hypothetical protein